jgi:hypothetical protein
MISAVCPEQPELREVLFPVFMHTFLDLVETARNAGQSAYNRIAMKRHPTDTPTRYDTTYFPAMDFFKNHAEHHLVLHRQELEILKSINSPAHALINPFVLRLRYFPSRPD